MSGIVLWVQNASVFVELMNECASHEENGNFRSLGGIL